MEKKYKKKSKKLTVKDLKETKGGSATRKAFAYRKGLQDGGGAAYDLQRRG
jgi:hypothetical protein